MSDKQISYQKADIRKSRTTAEYEKSRQIESDLDKETKAFLKVQINKGAGDESDS